MYYDDFGPNGSPNYSGIRDKLFFFLGFRDLLFFFTGSRDQNPSYPGVSKVSPQQRTRVQKHKMIFKCMVMISIK
jgi:hypothetical protein